MANPDPSDVFIVRGSLQLLEADDMNPTRTILFTSGTTGTQSWRVDDDYFVIGVTNNTTSAYVLSLNGLTTGQLNVAQDKIWADPGLILDASGFAGPYFGINFPISKNDKLYWSPAASGSFANIVLRHR